MQWEWEQRRWLLPALVPEPRLVFQSAAWLNASVQCYSLSTVFRQRDDEFVRLLGEARKSQSRQEMLDALNARTALLTPAPASTGDGG